jgi:hypothetical protein
MPYALFIPVVVLGASFFIFRHFFPKQRFLDILFSNKFKTLDQIKREDPDYGKFLETAQRLQLAMVFFVAVGLCLWLVLRNVT